MKILNKLVMIVLGMYVGAHPVYQTRLGSFAVPLPQLCPSKI